MTHPYPAKHRIVVGLEWARASGGPPAREASAASRVKSKGIKYEKAVAQAIWDAGYTMHHGVWFEFQDSNGHGWCQPDFLIDLPYCMVIGEAKLTYTPVAWLQIAQLYVPVVSMALERPLVPMVVCQHLTNMAPLGKVRGSLKAALQAAQQDGGIWNWSGPPKGSSGHIPGILLPPLGGKLATA